MLSVSGTGLPKVYNDTKDYDFKAPAPGIYVYIEPLANSKGFTRLARQKQARWASLTNCHPPVSMGGGWASRRVPVTLVADLEVLPCVAPVEGSHMGVTHPHEALGAQHFADWHQLAGGIRGFRNVLLHRGRVRHWQPLQHTLTEPASKTHQIRPYMGTPPKKGDHPPQKGGGGGRGQADS
jgi:hypothetical protein